MAKRTRNERQTPWKWRAEWLAYICVEKIAGALPGSWVFRAGEIVGGIAWYFMPLRRKIVLRNLRIAFYGEYDLPTLQKMAYESFCRTGANMFSTAHTARLSGAQIDAMLTVENQDLIEEAMAPGKGLVLMPSHMGNWEILSRMNRLFPQGHKIGAFYRPLNNLLMNARVVAQRETDGTHLFAKKDNLHQVTGFLREGSLVGILADQRVGEQGEAVTFFGRFTRASPLPSLLARRSKSRMLTMSLMADTAGRYRVRYYSVKEPFKTPECMAALEQAMRASPLDVFWLQERWKLYISSCHSIRDWLGPATTTGQKPHRALLWLVNTPDNWRVPETWLHPDVIYEVVLATGQEKPKWLADPEKFHFISKCNDLSSFEKRITLIDFEALLPIDYILTCNATKTLTKAAKRRAIPLVSLNLQS